jgi:hypothetical protein
MILFLIKQLPHHFCRSSRWQLIGFVSALVVLSPTSGEAGKHDFWMQLAKYGCTGFIQTVWLAF